MADFAEPQVAVGAAHDVVGLELLGHVAANGYSVTTPESSIRAIDSCGRLPSTNHRFVVGPSDDSSWVGIWNRELRHDAVRGHAHDLLHPELREPDIAVRSQVIPSAPTPLASGYLVMTPAGSPSDPIRAVHGPSGNHPDIAVRGSDDPSEPDPVAGTANWVIEPAGVTRPAGSAHVEKPHVSIRSGGNALRLGRTQPEHPEPGVDGLGTGYSTTPPAASFGRTGVACEEGGAIGPEHAANSTRHTARAARMPVQTRRGAANYASPSSIWSNGPGNRHGSQDRARAAGTGPGADRPRQPQELGDIRIDDVLSFIDRGIENMPSYMDLYRRWESQQWAVGDLDFTLDRQDWLEATEQDRKATLWSHRLFFNGEERVHRRFAPFVWAAPAPEIEIFLSTQMVDEARHTVFFDRWWHEVVGTDAKDLAALLTEIARTNVATRSNAPHGAPRKHESMLIEVITLYHIDSFFRRRPALETRIRAVTTASD